MKKIMYITMIITVIVSMTGCVTKMISGPTTSYTTTTSTSEVVVVDADSDLSVKEKYDLHKDVLDDEGTSLSDDYKEEFMEEIKGVVATIVSGIDPAVALDSYTTEYIVSAIYYSSELDGSLVVKPEMTLPDNYDGRERPWYMSAIEAGDLWSIAYPDPMVEDLILTIAYPVEKDGQVIGVLGVDYNIGGLKDMKQ